MNPTDAQIQSEAKRLHRQFLMAYPSNGAVFASSAWDREDTKIKAGFLGVAKWNLRRLGKRENKARSIASQVAFGYGLDAGKKFVEGRKR